MSDIHGYVGGAFKPYTRGHHRLVETAVLECPAGVNLFVSLKDRCRPGEKEILGAQMEKVWTQVILPVLPLSVTVQFSEQSPIKDIYVHLAFADRSGLSNEHRIYGDEQDIQSKFSDKKVSAFAPRLVAEGKIIRRPVSRTESQGISGTSMRAMLAFGLKAEFAAGLPDAIRNQANTVWDLLRS